MTPLTLQDVLAHQASVPWPELYQVEQDLLLVSKEKSSAWATLRIGRTQCRQTIPDPALHL
ncbi:MAG TPA: hypothetical protein VNO35_22075 [Steroidobacteraceae bacterium]|nr:hypothetical protein [Steroidobacteraceae bacterium]